jgi:hypothetical protein
VRISAFEVDISIHGYNGVKAVKASEGVIPPLFGYYLLNYHPFALVNYYLYFLQIDRPPLQR